jgi:predicted Zn-dependent protease
LIWFLMPGFARQNFDEGRSLIGEKLGQRLFGQHISLADEPLHPLLLSRPFDGEGVPTYRVELIRMGVPKGFLYGRRSAGQHKVSSTGHSPPQPSAEAESARGPVLSGGNGTVEDLVRSTGRGLLVTRLWYNRFVRFREHEVTGMTRDGLFAIEDGKLVGAVRNMRYNASLIDVLGSIEAMGTPVRSGGAVVPPLRVAGFNFTGATHF